MIRIRTGYSFRTASGDLGEVIDVLQNKQYRVAPITDRGNTFAFVKYAAKAAEAKLRPIFGVELGVTDSIHAKKPIVDYWTFIATDSIEPINKLVHTATNQFRYVPLITYEQALSIDAFKIAGHRAQIDHIKPADKLYFSLAPSTTRGYAKALLAKGVQPVACGDNRYARPSEKGAWEIICGRGAERQSYPQHILSEEEWFEYMIGVGYEKTLLRTSIQNSKSIEEGSTATLKRASLLQPIKEKTLLEMCKEGASALNVDLSSPVYAARLAKELSLIAEKNYDDYFYIVSDICQFARSHMLVGPARGSSCGSLVCYLLRITLVDPIPFGLIFERFIDITRKDLPDIDVDFSDERREMVFDYVIAKYGAERVARLGTVNMFKPRSVLQEASGALKIPKWECEAVSNSLIERSLGDSRALNTLEDTLKEMPAGKALLEKHPEISAVFPLEGQPRHYGQHAAGIVLAQEPVSRYVAIDARTGGTMCDKKDAEVLNLLKIDALGLTQLSIFEDTFALAGLPLNTLENIPYDDPLVFDLINAKKYYGIFQFNGIALQSIAKQFTFDCLNDIISATALARPGPLASGGADEWIKRRNAKVPVTYPHDMFKAYLGDTLGIVLYQEQVMEIGRNIGGLNWDQVTALRKAMSKSLGKEYFNQFGDPWKEGAIRNGLSKEKAEKVWDDLCQYGSWSFNKSHAVAYGLISYQCAYLKAHYPIEFAAASLSHEYNSERQLYLLREIVREGYEYIPVDRDTSTDKWSVAKRNGKKYIVGPLQNVNGIGPKLVSSIIGARRRGEALPDRANKLLTFPKTSIDSLFPIRDAFARILPNPEDKLIFTKPINIVDIQLTRETQTLLVFATPSTIAPRDDNDPAKVAQRGYKINESQTMALNLFLRDDTDEIFARIDRYDFLRLGKPIIDYGRPGKALWCFKGTVKQGKTSMFRVLNITHARFIGDMER